MFAICAFGDSFTFGRGNNPDKGWVGRLTKYFEAKDWFNAVYNLGIPGDSSDDLLKRFETECEARIKKNWPGDKYVLLIGIGINDCRFVDTPENPQTTPEDFKKNILNLIKLSKKQTKEVIFIGLTPVDEKLTQPYENTYFFNERVKQFNEIIEDCCKSKKILFVDLFDEWIKFDYTKLLDDGVHPNAEGYEKMYKKVKDFLISHKVID